MSRKFKKASCHPDKYIKAKGLCSSCFEKQYYEDPEKRKARTEKANRWLKNHPEYIGSWNRSRPWARRMQLSHPDRKELSLSFLTKLEAETKNCSCCTKPLTYKYSRGNGLHPADYATLDRIDPVQGYVQNNVSIICWECNRLKAALTVEKVRLLLRYMENDIKQISE